MILKDLELVNIRSHKEARIVFSSGITLFEGDVGSGKSSILMAVEFALFGLGSQRPEALLSQGAPSGSARLRFEVDGTAYEIKRELKRTAGRIGQDKKESYLARGADIENLAPSELKERVLGILGFNEPKGPRAASRIFRYAVYTPQGEMRRVLSDAKERLATVRRAFDMEQYDRARDNAKMVKDHIDREAARLEGRFAGLDEAEERAAGAKKSIAEAEGRLAAAKRALEDATVGESRAKAERNELHRRAAERDVLRERIAGLERRAAEAAARAGSLRGQAAEAAAGLEDLDEKIRGFREPPPPTARADADIAAEIDGLRKVRSGMDAAEARAGVLRQQLAKAERDLSEAGAAGDADAAAGAAADKRSKIESELSDARRRAEELAGRSSGVSTSLMRVKTEVGQARRELDRIDKLGSKCHTCETELTAEHLARIRGGRTAAIERGGAEAERLDAEQKGLDAETASLRSRTAELEGDLRAAADAEQAAAEARRARERLASELDSKSSELEAALAEAASLRARYATDRAADAFECAEEDPVGYLLRLREALAGRAEALARLAEMRERAGMMRRDMDARLADAEAADGDAKKAEAGLGEAKRDIAAFDGLDGELDALRSRQAELDAAMQAAADAEQAAADAEQAAADAEQAAAEAHRARERLASERDSKSSELEAALAEAASLRARYATDRAADAFECAEEDPVGYLLRLREALSERAEALARLAEMRERAGMMRRDMDARLADAEAADGDAKKAEAGLGEAKRDIAAFDGLDGELPAAESRLEEAQGRRRRAEADAAAHAESADGWRRLLEESEGAARKARRAKKEHERLSKYSQWIESYFMESVAHIERQVLVSLQAGLDEAYRGWFSTLIDDETKTSRIDDTFMPIVDQDGYEIDAAHLSGGERTSVSLAYRLALNTLLRRETRSLKSNLLVLDEPTDGFSKSQLDKVHAILKDLEYEQIIIVSHDRELEAHADHVFHVTKEGGSSVVRAAQ